MILKSLKASEIGIEKARKVLVSRQLRQEDLVGHCCQSRQPISNFFNGKPVSRYIFVGVCEFLGLDWQNIAEEQQVNNGKVPLCEQNGKKPPEVKIQTLSEDKLVFAIAGSIDKIDEAKLKAIVGLLQQISGDTSIEIVKMEEGSIRLILQGSEAGLARLKELYESGELTEVLDTPVEDVHFLSEETEVKSSSAELNSNQERYGEVVDEKRQSVVVEKELYEQAMDKQRIQEYIKLIDGLLRCPDGEESQILNANRELVDARLLQLIELVAEQLEADGNQNAADFLHGLNSQLTEALGILGNSNSANPSSQNSEQFLIEVLQATVDSVDNPEFLYTLLQANLDKLDDNFVHILRTWAFDHILQTWASNELLEAEPETAEEIANVIIYFSNRLLEFPLGSKATNVEISIAGYEKSLAVLTNNSHPEIWAMIQNNLGAAYSQRMSGGSTDNLEKAISAFQKALQVYTPEAFPIDLAGIQSNLGAAYSQRMSGDRAENLEAAIAAFQKALQVYTPEAFPIDWATTQNKLGNAYQERIRHDRGENLEKAIEAYQLALKVYTKKDFPQDWAGIQNNLGAAYQERIYYNKAENLEKAIEAYQLALKVYTKKDFPQDWAGIQNNLGAAYQERIYYNKAENLEKAIEAYQLALEVRAKEDLPYEWAMTQNNLSNAYQERIYYNKAENLEKAIEACQLALEVRTKKDFPQDWATTQNNLGLAYQERIRHDRAENLEKAIEAHQVALEVYTKKDFPQDWAMTQHNLGSVYRERIRHDRAENLEKAIDSCQLALEVRTKKDLPIQWAMTQHNLGNVYRERIRRDRADNLEKAIEAYQLALEVRTKEDFPFDWAMTQNSLGVTYSDRIRDDKAKNLEKAIEAYQLALEVCTKKDFPYEWAGIQNNLGTAYWNIRHDRAENLEKAIEAYQLALEVRTKKDFPLDWATIQHNLGAAYSDRIRNDRAENLEKAIEAYQLALEVRTKKDFPLDWAQTQNNLGLTYQARIPHDGAENLEKAIEAYQLALEVYTLEADPIEHFRTSNNLGNLHFQEENWQRTIDAYKQAILAVELRRSWAIADDDRQKILAAAIDVYQKQVQAYINIEQWDKAIETVERSKTQNLVELLANRELYPKGDVPQEIITELDRLRRSIPSLERQLQVAIERLSANTGEREEELRRSLLASRQRLQLQLQTSRQQLDEVLDRIKPIDSSFSLTQRVEQIAFGDIQSLMDDRGAAIEWYVTDDKILTFILTANSLYPLVEQASAEKLEALVNWGYDYLAEYAEYVEKKNQQWKANLAANLEKLAEILNIDRLLSRIDDIFDKQGEKCDRLLLIPHRLLHLFPLHALPLANGDLLMDRFARGLSYAPSIQLLQLSQTWSRPSLKRFFSVKNPTEDLNYADLEVNTIRNYFHPYDDVLERQEASKIALTTERLAQTNVAHFCCHGDFNFKTPSQSVLELAGSRTLTTKTPADRDGEAINLEKCLTLGEIFALDLRQCRLATLSACETGLTDFNSLGDEYIGLPSGFLYAGSPSVVSSLWRVDDVSTALLMIKFYQNLKSGVTVALALNTAQIWLRDATTSELQVWASRLKLDAKLNQQIDDQTLDWFDSDERPFQEPYHWAAFCAVGQ